MARVYNFSAGPSMLPESVLKKAQSELWAMYLDIVYVQQ